ncbi:N-acetylmuramoyl-L-alanine amidase [Aestuariispira insulae]|uniref:N-acetylmuramoyl-L-alanine amidase n=1 Tax=Aestuariispira insulae TaxID=1461337 RepID=A0A3D9HJF4_9PROT|nr:N-acetylmuramoyl-L-alanine amidase [Aestuariispira insulae]RED49652.1 N-acetylmuramoyl-L-alanine amidase [Aestuariispira insulae]
MDGLIQCPSPNFGNRRVGSKINMLVMHYTDLTTADEALDRLCDPVSEVSAHYLVTPRGYVYQLVEEKKRAWHAGVSSWRGITDVNSHSIGIEIANPGHANGYEPFPEAQMKSLAALCKEILSRHAIPARNIVGHSDVAPGRKIDPGELFDWKGLAEQGIGLWPDPDPDCARDPVEMLEELGYAVDDPRAAIEAFQRHYRPAAMTGEADAETVSLMGGLLKKQTAPA